MTILTGEELKNYRRERYREYKRDYRALMKKRAMRRKEKSKLRPDQRFPYPLVTCAQVLEAYAARFADIGSYLTD